jgi:hypothetical protein
MRAIAQLVLGYCREAARQIAKPEIIAAPRKPKLAQPIRRYFSQTDDRYS